MSGDTVKMRTIGAVFPDEDNEKLFVGIGHVWEDGEDAPPDQVGLIVGDGNDSAAIMLTPGEALMVANRLQRAAELVLEQVAEEAPDFSREFRRLTGEDKP